MADKIEKKDGEQRQEPGYKRFGGAKLVPPPAPIQQPSDEERFPVFIGVGIGLSILALITVCVLAAFSHKTKVNVPSPNGADPAQSASVTPGAGSRTPSPKSSHY